MSTPESRPEGAPEGTAEGTPEATARPELPAEAMPELPAETTTEAPSEAMPERMPDFLAAPGAQPAAGAGERPAAGAGESPAAAADASRAAGIEPGPDAAGDDLRAAVGLSAPPPRDRSQRRRTVLLVAALALLGVLVAGAVFLGRQNRQRYYLVCGEDDITAAQGRSVPPWGRSALSGKAWQAIPRPLDAPCADRELDGREALARSFGELLIARADAWVTTRADGAGGERLAEVQAQLEQAQRVLRELPEPGRAELSGRIERLRGDLEYWQARDRIDTALAELAKAAEHLDRAVTHDPGRNRENARIWQGVIARLRAELGRGTPGPAVTPTEPGAAQPAGPDAPVEPGVDGPSVPSVDSPGLMPGPTSDAGPDSAPSVPGATVPATPPDAGVSRGGLLI